jgi:hypothetical protein
MYHLQVVYSENDSKVNLCMRTIYEFYGRSIIFIYVYLCPSIHWVKVKMEGVHLIGRK